MNDLPHLVAEAADHDPAEVIVSGKADAVSAALANLSLDLSSNRPLIIVPNNNYKQSFKEACGDRDGGSLSILTALELCREVMWACEAEPPRVLLPLEKDLVIEDLKVTGTKPRRIEEMVRFFVRSLSELAERDPDWLVSEEERQMFSLLDNHLASRHLVFPNQMGGMALRALEAFGHDTEFSGRVVIVVGYTALDYATHQLIDALHPRLLVAGGRDDDCGVPQFPYFDAKALAQLRERGALEAHADDANRAHASVVRTDSPASEQNEAVRFARERLDEGVPAKRILVEAPNGAQLAKLQHAFEQAGIPAKRIHPLNVGKVTAEHAAHGATGALATLGLAADPRDANAWRTWFALGEWLGNSAAWSVLRAISAKSGLTLEQVLEKLLAGEVPCELDDEQRILLDRLSEPLARGREAIATLDGLSGTQLAHAIARIASPQGADALCIAEGEDAASAYARIRRQILDPSPTDEDAVLLGLQKDAIGLHADAVCHTGTLEGILPEAAVCDPMTPPVKQERLLNANRKVFGASLQHGAERIVFTWPLDMDVEEAGREKIHIERIYIKDGRRTARLARSRFLDELFKA